MESEFARGILASKWWLLLAFEIIAWISTVSMFYCRYFLRSPVLFWASTLLAGITGYLPHIVLAVLDFYQEGKVNGFFLFIILLITAGLLFGKKIVTKIDRSLMEWANRKRKQRDGSSASS